MRKLFFAIALCNISIIANAQTLIKGSYQKGDTAVYSTSIKLLTASPMAPSASIELTANANVRYAVQEANTTGYVIESLVNKFDIEGAEEQAQASQIGELKMLLNIPVVFSTDINGKPLHVINFDDVKAKEVEETKKMIENLYAANPMIEQVQSKDAMIANASDKITEESVLSQLDELGVFELNGKTISNGSTDSETKDGIKMKNIYSLTPILGTTVITKKSEVNMSEEDMKTFVISQMESNGVPAEQIEMVKSNWSQMVAMGMASLTMDGTTTFRLLKNGWPQDINGTLQSKIMGVDLKMDTTTKLSYKNF